MWKSHSVVFRKDLTLKVKERCQLIQKQKTHRVFILVHRGRIDTKKQRFTSISTAYCLIMVVDGLILIKADFSLISTLTITVNDAMKEWDIHWLLKADQWYSFWNDWLKKLDLSGKRPWNERLKIDARTIMCSKYIQTGSKYSCEYIICLLVSDRAWSEMIPTTSYRTILNIRFW